MLLTRTGSVALYYHDYWMKYSVVHQISNRMIFAGSVNLIVVHSLFVKNIIIQWIFSFKRSFKVTLTFDRILSLRKTKCKPITNIQLIPISLQRIKTRWNKRKEKKTHEFPTAIIVNKISAATMQEGVMRYSLITNGWGTRTKGSLHINAIFNPHNQATTTRISATAKRGEETLNDQIIEEIHTKLSRATIHTEPDSLFDSRWSYCGPDPPLWTRQEH